MPNYKTHSIHSELVVSDIDKKVDVNTEDVKKFAFGPDALMITDYKMFIDQHSHNSGVFFDALIRHIKEKKLQDNPKVMAFVYGQLDHYVLDSIMHPLIYYMTEKLPLRYKINPHALIEFWIDDYVMMKNNKKDYKYVNNSSNIDKDLAGAINDSYTKIYKNNNAAIKYDIGIFSIVKFDTFRKSKSAWLKEIFKKLKVGDIFHERKLSRVSNYLNLEHRRILHPITGEKYHYSFDDLWNESLTRAKELITDVNDYLYKDKPLNNYFIRENISYNTCLPCREKETFRYVKKYKPSVYY